MFHKESGVDESAVIGIAQDLYIVGTIIDRAYERYKNRPNEADAFTVQAPAELGQALPRT